MNSSELEYFETLALMSKFVMLDRCYEIDPRSKDHRVYFPSFIFYLQNLTGTNHQYLIVNFLVAEDVNCERSQAPGFSHRNSRDIPWFCPPPTVIVYLLRRSGNCDDFVHRWAAASRLIISLTFFHGPPSYFSWRTDSACFSWKLRETRTRKWLCAARAELNLNAVQRGFLVLFQPQRDYSLSYFRLGFAYHRSFCINNDSPVPSRPPCPRDVFSFTLSLSLFCTNPRRLFLFIAIPKYRGTPKSRD